MKYLLDTCVLVDHLRGRVEIKPEWLKSGAAISVITWGELMHGVEKSNNKKLNDQLVRALVEELSIEIMSTDKKTAEVFGFLKYRQEKTGLKVDDFDLLIASTAVANDLIVVTNNKKHFNKIKGLKMV